MSGCFLLACLSSGSRPRRAHIERRTGGHKNTNKQYTVGSHDHVNHAPHSTRTRVVGCSGTCAGQQPTFVWARAKHARRLCPAPVWRGAGARQELPAFKEAPILGQPITRMDSLLVEKPPDPRRCAVSRNDHLASAKLARGPTVWRRRSLGCEGRGTASQVGGPRERAGPREQVGNGETQAGGRRGRHRARGPWSGRCPADGGRAGCAAPACAEREGCPDQHG